MSKTRDRLFLVDGSAVFYRAYFAFIRRPLINSKGENTSATFGFVSSLLKIIREESPQYLAIIFDSPKPTFRHKMYSEYKATRAKMPDDLASQIPRIYEAVEALNIAHYKLDGYEADDIIGTFADKGEKAGLEVHIVTGDKDCFQLVTENVKIYNLKSASGSPEVMGREEVKEKFGVYPELVIDKLALMGDSSDNIPGVPGVGPKTADKLLDQFGTLDEIFANSDQIEAKGIREKVAASHELAILSRRLVIIDKNVPLDFEIDKMRRREINYEATKTLFEQLELKKLLAEIYRMTGRSPAEGHTPEPENQTVTAESKVKTQSFYHTVTTLSQLKKLVREFSKSDLLAVDTETTSLNALKAKLVGVSLSDRAGVGYYIPLGHTSDTENNLPFEESLQLIKSLLENKRVKKIGQNIKYDLEVLHNYDIDIDPVAFDTMLASYVIDPSVREHGLDALARKHLDYRMQPITDLIGKGKNQTTFDTVPVEKATPYAAEDADITFRLYGKLSPKIKELELSKLYEEIELPLIRVLASMEQAGVRIDDKYLSELSVLMEKKLSGLISEIYQIAGGEFNINSTKQLSHVLFEKLGLPTKGKTAKKTGFSTDVKVLEELSKINPLPGFMLEYRAAAKLKNTYIDALPRLINPETGRVHTSFNQTIAATGRLSSTNPNLQNIPIRTEEGRQIRKAFIPRDGDHELLVADYSQIELRILAHYASDPVLIRAFEKSEDIHRRTAAEVYGVAINKVSEDQRRAAKTANFAIIYGVSAYGLTQQTELNLGEAKDFIERYFERYTGIKSYMESTREFARANGYVTTLFNRRRPIPDINDRNVNVRQFAERVAINTPIQGTAADMIKIAMIRIHKQMKGMKSRMILQVHDELVFDAHKSELDDLKIIVKEGMEQAVKLKVPVAVEIGAGANWLDAK